MAPPYLGKFGFTRFYAGTIQGYERLISCQHLVGSNPATGSRGLPGAPLYNAYHAGELARPTQQNENSP